MAQANVDQGGNYVLTLKGNRRHWRQKARQTLAEVELATAEHSNLGHEPLFSALLNYRQQPDETQASGELECDWPGIEFLGFEERTNCPLTVSVDDLGDAFRLTVRGVASITRYASTAL